MIGVPAATAGREICFVTLQHALIESLLRGTLHAASPLFGALSMAATPYVPGSFLPRAAGTRCELSEQGVV